MGEGIGPELNMHHFAGGALAASALICAAQAQPPNTSPPVQAPDVQAPSLAEAVEAAWLRSAEAAHSRGQQQQSDDFGKGGGQQRQPDRGKVGWAFRTRRRG